jgi:hypothetical protein
MKNNAVRKGSANRRMRLIPAALLGVAAMLLAGFAAPAAAAPVKGGKIYACYKVKGKPRGAMRVLFQGKRCKRGERRVAWVAAGSSRSGQGGSDGQSGQTGQAGATGTQGAGDGSLSAQVSNLNLKVDGLEETLKGVSNGDLLGTLSVLDGIGDGDLGGVLSTLKGLDNEELTDAVEMLPAVDSLCKETEVLAEQVNALQGVIEGLGLEPALELIGLLEIPEPPDALKLEEFGCPTPTP